MISLKEIQNLLYFEYQKNGYEDFWNSGETLRDKRKSNIAELGFITTEISEAIEITFKHYFEENYKTELGLECADIIIRTLNFMKRNGLNAEDFILRKNEENNRRGLLHGKAKP